ncbi:MAG: PQQ-binding-like beta-propeller repeat protein [Planctomycetaceae bacterium]
MNRFDRKWAAAALVAAVGLPAALSAQIQFQLQPVPAARPAAVADDGADAEDEPAAASRMLAEDRTMTRRMRIAQRLLNDGSPAEGLELLQRILDHPEDFPFNPEEGDRSLFRSLKGEAARLIAELPPEHRALYEQQSGAEARRLLNEAVAGGNIRRLEEVTRRYFHTQAGYEATDRLATQLLDRSEPLAAALHFERLRRIPRVAEGREPMLSLKAALAWARAGFPEESRAALLEMKSRSRDGGIVLGERTLPVFDDDADAFTWLSATLGVRQRLDVPAESEWPVFRGNAARTAAVSSASPVWAPQWEVSTLDAPYAWEHDQDAPDDAARQAFAEAVRQQVAARRKSGEPTLPAVHPLVVGNAVVYRTAGNLRAVDFTTGRRMWEAYWIDPKFKDVVASKGVPRQVRSMFGTANVDPREAFMSQRLWSDHTAGTLSSDGRLVFSVEDLGYVLGDPQSFLINQQQPGMEPQTTEHNQLVAHDVATGKLMWVMGGAPEDGMEAAGAFFLGPPLPMGGRLYCLAQQQDEVRLLVLDPRAKTADHKSGAVLWSQAIALSGGSIHHPLRRSAGISPSYHDGVLVCPTGAGGVVAVDPGQRTLMWAYQYESSVPDTTGDINAFMIQRQRAMQGQLALHEDETRWMDSVATIADGKVLLAPRDSDQLHCLSLADGRRLWRQPRRDGLYLAGVFDGKAIVVGRTEVAALDLADGTPAWDEPVPIPLPAGRGVRSGEFYRLPLSTGELATLDLRHGRLVARSPTPAGVVPGNLIAARGALVSQTADSVLRLESLDAQQKRILAALKDDPNDAEALGLRGAIELHAGNEARGLADLRKAVQGGASPRIRRLLAATLLEGLRHDFAAYREYAEEIRELVDDPKQRSQFLRLHAAGLHKIGEHEQAFHEYLRLADPATDTPELQAVNAGHSVRSDRWVRPRITAVYAAATDEIRAKMDSLLEAESAQAAEAEGTEGLKRVLACFRDVPPIEGVRWRLVERLPDGLEAELHLLKLRDSRDDGTAGRATARLAKSLIDGGRGDGVPALLDDLRTRFAEVVCLDGRTGRELVADWTADSTGAAAAADRPVWPARRIEASATRRQARAVQQSISVEADGPAGPFFEGWSFRLDQARQQRFTALDSHGRKRWEIDIQVPQQPIRNPYAVSVRVHGRLIVVGYGSHFVVLDGSSGGAPTLLWHQSLHDGTQQPIPMNRPRAVGGGIRMVIVDANGRSLGSVGPIGDDFICYQVGTTLHAADPLTGETLWTRRNLPRGAELFGDDEFVFCVPPRSDQATVLRGADGETIGERDLPAASRRLLTSGRNILVRGDVQGESELSLLDAFSGETAWKLSIPATAFVDPVGDDEIAIVEGTSPVPAPAGEAQKRGAARDADRREEPDRAKRAAIEEAEAPAPAKNERRGRFRIVSLEDGKVRLDQPLEASPGLAGFHVLRQRGQYVLLTNDPGLNQEPNVQRTPINNNQPLVNGHCYAFDRSTGEPRWSRMIAHQSLPPGQPRESPALLLALRTYVRIQQGGRLVGPTNNQADVLLIDVRTGETALEEQSQVMTMGAVELDSDPEEERIRIDLSDLTVAIGFGDEPLKAGADSPRRARVRPSRPPEP